MLVDDDCIRSLPAEPNFCGGPKRCTPFRPLYSVLNTLMQVCSSLNIHQSGAFQVGYKYVCIRDCGSNLYVGMRVVEMF